MPDELRTFGFGPEPAAVRAAKLRETLEIVELMFSGETFDYAGEHFTLHARPDGRCPCNPTCPCTSAAADRSSRCRSSNGSPTGGTVPATRSTGSTSCGHSRARARISTQHPIGLARSTTDRDDAIEQVHRRFGSWGGVIAGTADEVAAALAVEVDRGVEGFVCQFSDFGTPETVERFMREVVPAVLR